MQYKVGQKIRIRSKEWILENCQKKEEGYYYQNYNYTWFIEKMFDLCDKTFTITDIYGKERIQLEGLVRYDFSFWMIYSEIELMLDLVEGGNDV